MVSDQPTPRKVQARQGNTATPIKATDMRQEYDAKASLGEALISFVKLQIETFIAKDGIALGFPVSGRVKDYSSVIDKSRRKNIELENVDQFTDFVGLRIVLLFKRDIDKIDHFIKSTFNVVEYEDTSQRLSEDAFGYQSNHYIVNLPQSWIEIPSLSDIGKLKVEIQVRTIAQHMWAAVSHKLQYKIEDSVPYELRRAINRSSAILELIDLEFDRVMNQRDAYTTEIGISLADDLMLNVDIVRKIMSEMLPAENQTLEDQPDLIALELGRLDIKTVGEMKALISDQLDYAIEADKEAYGNEEFHEFSDPSLLRLGKFYNGTGMMRAIMKGKFGSDTVNTIMVSRDDEDQ